jgi:hypothetical protein
MLVPFTDTEGREVWINPIHVKVVRVSKGLLGGVKGTEIWFGWTSTSQSVNVRSSPDEVAAALSAAMPPTVPLPAVLDSEDDEPHVSHDAS